MGIIYQITPMGAPRMTRADAWKDRPVVLRYRDFKDQVRDAKIDLRSEDGIVFVMPMPESWSKKKKAAMVERPHKQTPDLDNLLKALMDALFEDDAHIHSLTLLKKVWGYHGGIIIHRA